MIKIEKEWINKGEYKSRMRPGITETNGQSSGVRIKEQGTVNNNTEKVSNFTTIIKYFCIL